jgi:hypothetical protein
VRSARYEMLFCYNLAKMPSRTSVSNCGNYGDDGNSGNPCGAIAQLGERIVRNDEVVGSIPTSSTILNL